MGIVMRTTLDRKALRTVDREDVAVIGGGPAGCTSGSGSSVSERSLSTNAVARSAARREPHSLSAVVTDSLVMIGVRSYSGGGPDCVHSRADHDTPPLRGPMPRRDRRMGAGVVV